MAEAAGERGETGPHWRPTPIPGAAIPRCRIPALGRDQFRDLLRPVRRDRPDRRRDPLGRQLDSPSSTCPRSCWSIVGTFAVTAISYSLARGDPGAADHAAHPVPLQPRPRTTPRCACLQLAERARKRGLLQLQSELYGLRPEPFLHRSMSMLVDGIAVEEIERNDLRDPCDDAAPCPRATAHPAPRRGSLRPPWA